MYKLENDVAWTTDLKNAFKHGVTRGKIKYYDDNNQEVIITESNGIKSIKIYDEKNVPKQGFIGQATSKQADLELLNIIDTHNLENKEIEVFLGANYNSQSYYINYGKFIVNQAPENDVTNGIIKITAFDYMIKTNIPYIPIVTFPCTLKDVVDDICTQTSLTLATQNFANMNFIVDSNQFDGKTCKEVLRHVGKCAFSWVRIGQDNQLYIDFEVTNTVTESLTTNDYYQDKLKKANEYYGPINRVVYAESNIQGQEEKVEDTDSIALNGLHELVIYDNYFAYTTEKRYELIQAGTRLFGLKYMPVQEMAMVGLVYLDCTDIIEVTTPDEETFTTIPLSHIIEYNGAIGDSLQSETNSDVETAYKNTNDPMNAQALAEVIIDRAMQEIRMIVGQYVNFLHNKTGNNNLFINEARDGEGFITKFIIKGNTTYFENLTRLPIEYQEVEYIENTGEQYINTNYIPNDNSRIEMVATAQHGNLIGIREDITTRIGIDGLTLEFNTDRHFLNWNNKSNYYDKIVWGNKYLYEFSMSKTNLNGDIKDYAPSSYSWNYPFFLFAENNSGIAKSYCMNKIYSCKIYEEETLVRDLVPCYRKSDNEIGMYDLVNDVFYTNAGTGDFNKGNNEINMTLIVSEGIKNQETVLVTESNDTLLTEDEDSILAEDKTLYIDYKEIELNNILRNLIVGNVNYYDEFQILQDGTMQIIKRIGISQNDTPYLLDEEEVEILPGKFVLPTRENGLYYFIKELNNLDYYAEYIIKNEYSDVYATEAYVRAGLGLKVDSDKLVSELNASADIIKLIGERLIILMQNYSLDENGYMKALVGEIAGFLFTENRFSKSYNTLYNFTTQDVQLLMGYLNSYNSLSNGLQSLYELTGDSSLNVLDVVKMINIINGTVENDKTSSGEVSINSNNSNALIEITNSLNMNKTRFGIFSVYAYLLSASIISLTDADSSDINGIVLDKNKRQITVKSGNNETIILPTGIQTPTLTQTSLAKDKKDFKLLSKALEEVMNTDIYEYHLNSQKDEDKKHIGFVIGDKFKYSHLITAEDENHNEIGVEPYSMISVLWKAVQEQQKQIDELQKEIKILKGEK